MRPPLLALLVSALLVLPACASTRAYSGPEQSEGRLAVIVPDSPAQRVRDNPLGNAGGYGGQVYLRVNGTSLGSRSTSFQVAPGRVEMLAFFRDHQTPIPARMLQTKPVPINFTAEAGRTYRVRGAAFYPPPSSEPRRAVDASGCRVVLAIQDMSTGRIIQKLDVPSDRNVLVDPITREEPW